MTLVFRGRAPRCAPRGLLLVSGAAGANAAIITSHDDQGRTITFDVRAATVDTEWYASVLRASAHGNEISDVTIVIVPEPQVQAFCGGDGRWQGATAGARPRRSSFPLGRASSSKTPPARVRASPRHVLACLRRPGAERDAGMVGGAGDGVAACRPARSRSTTHSAGATASARSSPRTTRTSTSHDRYAHHVAVARRMPRSSRRCSPSSARRPRHSRTRRRCR